MHPDEQSSLKKKNRPVSQFLFLGNIFCIVLIVFLTCSGFSANKFFGFLALCFLCLTGSLIGLITATLELFSDEFPKKPVLVGLFGNLAIIVTAFVLFFFY